jgi:DNA-binding NarL/FixJ family response regulator
MSRPIRLLLVDDHASSREPLALLLDRLPDLEVAGQAGSLAEARRLLGSGVRVDVAVVDLDLGDGSGVDLIHDL